MNVLKRARVLQLCTNCIKRQLQTSSAAVDMAFYSYEKLVEGGNIGQPMIILHGLMGSRQNWQSLAKVFGKDGRRVIAVDARNHGESIHVPDMSYFLFRDDLLRLMDSQNIEDAVIVGHSMGGKTAMLTALTQPERVTGLVVVDVAPTVSPNIDTHPAYLEAMLKIPLMTMDDGSDTKLSTMRKYVLSALSDAVKDESMAHFLASNLIIKDDRFQWRCNLDSIINNFHEIASFPEIDTEPYHGRALFVGGSRSNYITDEEYPVIKTLFPQAEIQHIQGAGHWVHSEKPQLFIQVVNDFLKDAEL